MYVQYKYVYVHGLKKAATPLIMNVVGWEEDFLGNGLGGGGRRVSDRRIIKTYIGETGFCFLRVLQEERKTERQRETEGDTGRE